MKTIKLKSMFALILFSILTFGLASIATSQNDFSLDGNAVALWSLEETSGDRYDSIGTNTLTDNNTVGTDTVNYKEGNASADFTASNTEYLSRDDANLDSSFPLKSSYSGDGTFSITFWYKAKSQGNYRALVAKENYPSANQLMIRDHNGTLQFYIGHTNGTNLELLDASYTSLTTGRWYHIGATFNNSTKAWQLRIYDDSETGDPLGEGTGVVHNVSNTATNNMSLTGAPFAIGTWFNGGTPAYPVDGLIDEVVVFSDILTTGEIDQIRSETYSGPAPTTTTTTLPPTTTTTLFPPTTTTTLFPPTTTTTLQPAGNDFSGDGNAVARWDLEETSGTRYDSIGGNDLTGGNSGYSIDTQEGTNSADFESSNTEYLSIDDAFLDSSFPLKSSYSGDGTFSITFWYKAESQGPYRGLVTKENYNSANQLMIRDSNGTLQFYIGNGGTLELLDASYTFLTTGRWYHIGATFNNTSKAWQLRIYDDSETGDPLLEGTGVVHYAFGTATNKMSLTTAPFAIGTWFNGGTPAYPVDGLIDEVVVFRDILTTGEIDQIRQGTYAVVYTPTTTTTLAPTTTTTTLAPTTTTTTTTTTTLPPGDYPTLSSATLGTDGTTLTLVFNQSVDIGVGGSGGFDIDVSGSTQNIACNYSSGSDSTTLIYTTGQTLWSGTTLNLDYAQPGDGVEATDDGFDVLTFADASITNNSTATTTTTTTLPPLGTNISNNGFEDSFPKTAGGYVVWQGKAGNDWEIFLYNANNGSGPFQITDNDYGDVNPETDGRYVTWASGFSPNGEIFLYDIETQTTTRITDYQYTDQLNTSCKASADPYPCCTDGGICVYETRVNCDGSCDSETECLDYGGISWDGRICIVDETPVNCDGSCDSYYECVDTYGGTSWTGTGTCNSQYDHDPKIVDGVVVWVSHSEGVDALYGPGDIMLYNAADGFYDNISGEINPEIDPNNDHDDYAFRFDGNRIQWVQNTSGDMDNYVYDPITDSWGQESNSNIRNYVYDLTTDNYYRYYIPDDEDLNPDTEYYVFGAEYYVEDLTANTAYIQTDSPAVLVDQQSDGDFSVNTMWINGDREILLRDRQNKHGGFLTDNDIRDIQPATKDNIVVWTGGEGSNSEIYLYKIKVIATTQGTAALIDQFISSGDISDPGKLYDYLLTAQGYIDSGDYKNAVKKGLENFKKELDTLKDKKGVVSEAAFVVLTGAADEMIVELSGGAPPI